MKYKIIDLAKMIDHTELKAYADETMIKKVCDEAKQYHFGMVAINSYQTKFCHDYLKGCGIHVGAAIGFPLGQTTIAAKVFETQEAIADGADEIDYVLNLAALKNKQYAYVQKEMQEMVNLCHIQQVIVKVILEVCYLTAEEIGKMCEIANIVKPDFLKTSTGFGSGGATAASVKLMRERLLPTIAIKAAGGIRDSEKFKTMVRLGATRIGATHSIAIIEGLLADHSYSDEIEI